MLSAEPGGPAVPDISIDAGQVPVDALLIQALPGEPYREPTEDAFNITVPSVLQESHFCSGKTDKV